MSTYSDAAAAGEPYPLEIRDPQAGARRLKRGSGLGSSRGRSWRPWRRVCPSPASVPRPHGPTEHDMLSDSDRQAAHQRDARFVERLLRRESAALDEMGRRLACLPAMLRYQARRIGAPLSEHELEEVAQDTVVALWRKLPTFEGRASLETWAFRFATLELLKAVQRRARRPQAVVSVDHDFDLPAEDEGEDELPFEEAEIRADLDRLTPAAARVIRRRHDDEESFEEIALAEGLPLNTVKARYYRGLARLREHLERRLSREEGP